MKIYQCEQLSDEWHELRLGKITASHFADVLNKRTGRETYMYRLLAERLTGLREESFQSRYMEEGIEKEPAAREHYAFVYEDVETLGFVEMSPDVGCSPDGWVGKDGMIEIKCPKVTTHIGYILQDRLPPVYVPQVQGQMWICKRQWCDFISYAPEYEKRPFWVKRVGRDDSYIAQLSAATATFVTELLQLQDRLT